MAPAPVVHDEEQMDIIEPQFPVQLGRYEVLERLGRGGMAEVYRARLRGPHGVAKEVAIKRILPDPTRGAEFVKMFLREARLSMRLAHPNLIQVFELGQEGQELFLAMELVEGSDLRQVLLAQKGLGKPMPQEIAVAVVHGILQGLEFAHRLTGDDGAPLNVVHRDLSPSNVMLSNSGTVKVADFGVAHVDGPERSDANLLKGKVSYMAPEQLRAQPVDARTDVFAAACVLYEMLAGEPVYGGRVTPRLVQKVARGEVPNVRRTIPYIDPPFAEVVQRALSPVRELRTPSAAQFDAELMDLVNAGRLRMARESELALYLEVLIPREVPQPAPTPQPKPRTQPTAVSSKPPPEPLSELFAEILAEQPPQEAPSNVIELRTGDMIQEQPSIRGANALRLTPLPMPPLDLRPRVEVVSERHMSDTLVRRRRGRWLAATLGALGTIAFLAAVRVLPRPSVRAPAAPFDSPMLSYFRLEVPQLKLSLPDLELSRPPLRPRRARRR